MERGPNEPCFEETFRYDNALIKPEKKIKETSDFKVKYLLIDSRDRNYSKYPNSNDYKIMLNEPIKDVVEIELIQAHIPPTAYLVNNNNNKIYYYIGLTETDAYNSPMKTAIVEVGNWDMTNIASRITEAFRVNNDDISVYFSEHTNKFSFIYNDDSDETYDTAGSNKNIYLDFRNTTNTNPPVVIETNYDQNGNTDTSYKNESMGEILGYTKKYNSTDNECYVDFDVDTTADGFASTSFNVELFNENGERLSGDGTATAGDPTNIVSYFIVDVSKSQILLKNPNFKITIGTVIKVFYNTGPSGYVTGIIEDFMSNGPSNVPTSADRIRCTWLSGFGADTTNYNLNEGVLSNLDRIYATISNASALLGGDDYILLKIPTLERYEGRNTNIEKSYAKLHLGGSTRNIFFGRISNFSTLHVLDTTIQKFDRLHIQYTDYYGNPYDFNNSENSLIFAIKYKTQPGKYDF